MNDPIFERARELGRYIGQTDEYRAVARARDRFGEDQDAVGVAQRLQQLESEIARALQAGQEPDAETAAEYEAQFGTLQSNVAYQALVAAQSNFEKVLARVNEEITKGIETGAQSRIILPS
jgi:cell fate (sporulation/competence/biofilm development) regulator YlbF (YheA/YmcA/DUF963 family)